MLKVFPFLVPSDQVPKHLRQLVDVTNILALILSGLTFILFLILFQFFGWIATSKFIISVAVIFLCIIFLNKRNWNAGRLIFCLAPVWMTLFITMYGKTINFHQSYIGYFDSRLILVATTILPAIVFRLNERVRIFICFASTFICLILFDPLHNLIGVGYFQRGFTAPAYYYINYVSLISYFVILFGVLVLKFITEKAEQNALVLINEKDLINTKLSDQNVQLLRLNEESEAQNEELQQQKEALSSSREMLQEANELISQQQQRLIVYNTHLEELVEEKNQSLLHINEELVKHNNELRQFSYTVSHNLRGPVARLLGLSNIVNRSSDGEEQKNILSFIKQSAIDLDSVLKDLNHIIDIRNELYNVREKVILVEEWNKVLGILNDNIKPEFTITDNFTHTSFVFAIRAMLHSILFNLLSNAIKYRAPDRPLVVKVSSLVSQQNETILEIMDNGLGIDLDSQRQNVFKLYKRFHTHVGGKGLGLFLVKTQVEALNGSIEIESQLNVGTCFRIKIPTPPSVDKQIFFESEAAQLYYDANINNTLLIWKRNVTSADYRNAFETLLKTLKTYNTPGWIADLRDQGKVEDEDQIWFLTEILPEAVRHGLKRIAAIGFKDVIRESYYNRMILKVGELGVELRVFAEEQEAHLWMQSFLHEPSSHK
ncbi:MAG: ATP-binding protein [Chryseolinea sp.]